MKNRAQLAATILLVASVAGLGLAAPATAHPSAVAKGKLITSKVIKLGRILSDSKGHTMYLFTRDTAGKSHCGKVCQLSWPPVRSKHRPRAGTDVKQRHLARTPSHQVTYHGHPLYYFSGDSGKSHSGEGLKEFGAHWYVVSVKGTPIQPKSSTTTTGGGTPPPPPPPYIPPAPTVPAMVDSGTLTGTSTQVLTNHANGKTLYYLTSESSSTFRCTNTCQKTWVPLMTKGDPSVASGASGVTGTLSTTIRTDDNNESQVTYDGYPVYTYSADSGAGSDVGYGVYDFGGYWYPFPL